MSPNGASSLRRELLEVRARLEAERVAAASERQESRRLRSELSARRDRERWDQSDGIIVKLARLTRILHSRPLLQQHRPVHV